VLSRNTHQCQVVGLEFVKVGLSHASWSACGVIMGGSLIRTFIFGNDANPTNPFVEVEMKISRRR